MKKILIAIVVLLANYHLAKAQLTIYPNIQQTGTGQVCAASGLYIGANIPGGLNNRIRSIKLDMGFMATLAENEDGTGKSFNYIAVTSNLTVDLAAVLQNRVSFIRVMPIRNITKKGMGSKNNTLIADVNPNWFYDWGALDVSTTNTEFVPMAWNITLANNFLNLNTYPNSTDINTLLAFNEPDGTGQANIPDVNVALPVYKNLLRTGYRMGSPATKEENWNRWLSDFTTIAEADDARIDFVAIHWYDWGNWSSSNGDVNPTPQQLLTRLNNYINNVYNRYGKPIWITEFNANVNRPAPVQDAFMRLALPSLDANPKVERYAYFFETTFPAVVNGTLTALGQTYKDHVSTASLTANVVDTRPTNIASTTDNLVFNGDFEDATSYTNGWTLSSADFAKEASSNSIANSTIRFTNVNGNSNIRSTSITVEPGKTYQLQFTARIQSAIGPSGSPGPTRGGIFSAEILNGSNSAATTFTPLTTTSSNNTTLFATYTVPLGQSSIRLRFTKTADIAYLDDVSFIEVNTLPISLLSFAGNANNEGIKINWQTNSEVNNEKFTLFRSTDGKNFSPISTIKGSGNSSKVNSYSYLDKSPAKGVNYYQLSQTDFDGNSEVFSPIAVSFKLENLEENLTVYSDSKNTQIGLNWSSNEMVTFSVFDLSGKTIFTNKINLQNGKNLVNLDTANNLASHQVYILRINGAERNTSAKFISNR